MHLQHTQMPAHTQVTIHSFFIAHDSCICIHTHNRMTYTTTRKKRKRKIKCANRLSIVAFRASGAGVRASPPPFLTRPPPSPTAHGHLQTQSTAKEGELGQDRKALFDKIMKIHRYKVKYRVK